MSVPTLSLPPADLAGWVRAFDEREIPVLASTARSLNELRENEDAVDGHLLAPMLAGDPLMTLKLLRHVARLRARRDPSGHAETATEALVMLGIPPFFRAFASDMPTVEALLEDRPEALQGFQAVLSRANRAANFALGFAAHRQDQDASVIEQVTLLHDFTELLLWVHAPALALALAQRQRAEPGLRSSDAQRQVLRVTLADLQQVLMRRWHLPELLIRIADDAPTRWPQVRNVQLAIRLARHSANGWDNPALPDDIAELGDLLQLTPPHVLTLAQDIDACPLASA